MDSFDQPSEGLEEESNLTEITTNVWSAPYVRILSEWSDKAMSYRWMHRNCNNAYSWRNAWFTIPVITISTVTGTANFAMDSLNDEQKEYAPIIIGSLNIIAGLIGTIHQYLKISEINEGHRVAYIAWDKFYRNIKLELSKPAIDRANVHDFVRICKEEYDRLMETSPAIDKKVVQTFIKTFENDNIIMPEVCDKLIKTAQDGFDEKSGTVHV